MHKSKPCFNHKAAHLVNKSILGCLYIGDHHTTGVKTKNGTVHTHIWSKVFLISEESYFMHNITG